MPNKKRDTNQQAEDGECPVTHKDSLIRETEKRSYYYDDAHGYEEFDPEADTEEEDEDKAAS